MKIKSFTVHHPDHSIFGWPGEDFFKFYINKDKKIFVVADGITRDPLGFKELPDLHSVLGEIEFGIEYPIPSPARKAAELFCESFISICIKSNRIGEEKIKGILSKANRKIWKLNKNLEVDYLTKDYAGCVGVAGIIRENRIYYGFVADCGLAIFDKKGRLKFRTKNEGPNEGIGKKIKIILGFKRLNWKDPEYRREVRKNFRNNSKEKLSYGAFTGEEEAMKFVKVGRKELEEGEYVLFYSDGAEKIIFKKGFNIKRHFEILEDYFKKKDKEIVGAEASIIALRI